MKRYIFLTIIVSILTICQLSAQGRKIEEIDYRRNSIYSIIINHTEQNYGSNIADMFVNIPVPDKYNDHDLSVKVVEIDKKTPNKEKGEEFLTNNNVASHLVARWFNRNPLTGECNMDLIKERGLYNASEFDRQIASRSIRGNAMLEDAGEDLIHNTFVLVNDIYYLDKEKQGKAAGVALNATFTALSIVGGLFGVNASGLSDIGGYLQDMMETLKGFKVKVTTHLYRLVWDEATAYQFYENMYSEKNDPVKKQNFDENRSLFKLEYVGTQVSSGSDVSFIGINLDTPDEMIRKACTRAIDENVANLSKNFEPFKIKVKLTSSEPIQAPIGKKEEITEQTVFEVLQPIEKDGKVSYRQVATIKPIKNMIWDNRYMAKEEGAVGSDLNYTTFEKVSGGEVLPGMLIREKGK